MASDKKMTMQEAQEKGLTSQDIPAEKRAQLQRIFPEVFTEDKIDFEQFRRVLGDWIEPGKERFGLTWPGKADCMKAIQAPSTAALKPVRDDSVNFDETENVFIEGDNLEVLKLLQKAYFGKIKMIYIDPPYNTGNEFIYPDKFSETLETYLLYTGQIDGNGQKFSTNTEADGRYHSKWLSMMYPRLYLARNLLSEDGVIFISIDDNEVDNLKLLCDLVFGPYNFISKIIIQSNKRGQTFREISKCHEYILIYYKGDEGRINELARERDFRLGDENGGFELWELRNRNPKFGRHNAASLYYPIYADPTSEDENALAKISLEKTDKFNVEVFPRNKQGQDGCWRWGKKKLLKEGIEGMPPKIFAKKKRDGGWNIYEKSRKNTTKAKSIWQDSAVISEQGTVEAGKLGLSGILDFPKPLELVKRCVEIGSVGEDIVLDFFSGFSTTAHAVFAQNISDEERRKCILVQLPEPTYEVVNGEEVSKKNNQTAYESGYRNIAEIGRERIRKAAAQIRENYPSEPDGVEIDLGFKAFKLDRSNFKIWDGDVEKAGSLEEQLESHIDHVDSESSPEEVLYELLLKAGYELTIKAEKRTMAGKDVYAIDGGALLICLEKEITEALIDAMAEADPRQVICLDEGFKGDDQLKTNAVQTFKSRAESEESEIIFKTV